MTENKTIVFATNNSHKLEEIRQILGDRMNVLSLKDISCHEDIPESGTSLEENALIKAVWVKEKYGYDCFADDTGLEVESLDGAPGVMSARYAGGDGHDSVANMSLLLENMREKENRAARFRTVIALIEGEKHMFFEGIVDGSIMKTPRGEGGFGYDPVFCPTGYDKSFAEITADEKNAISHRGRATKKLIEYLNK